MITLQTIKTLSGFRTYGSFSAIMDTDQHGNITYSNLHESSPEFQKMKNNSSKFRIQYYLTHKA